MIKKYRKRMEAEIMVTRKLKKEGEITYDEFLRGVLTAEIVAQSKLRGKAREKTWR